MLVVLILIVVPIIVPIEVVLPAVIIICGISVYYRRIYPPVMKLISPESAMSLCNME